MKLARRPEGARQPAGDGRHCRCPGTAVKTVDPETGADLPRGTEGMILVKGPQVMVGYLNRPEATAKVLKDGWYTTGDLGIVDADGFLKITGRLSRFSKIGGEMVPHMAVESAILEVAGATEQAVAVTSLPDPKRGERLCVLYTDLGMPVRRGHPPAPGRDAPAALDSLGRRLPRRGSDPDPGHRQGRSPRAPRRSPRSGSAVVGRLPRSGRYGGRGRFVADSQVSTGPALGVQSLS